MCVNDTGITATIIGQSNGGGSDMNMNMSMPTVTVTQTQAGPTSTTKPSSANGVAEAFGMTLAIVVGLACVASSGLGF